MTAAEARVEAAVRELVAALIEAARATQPDDRGPEELLGVREVMRRTSLGRTLIYDLLRRGELRSVSVRRRRLVPAGAVREFVERQVAR